MFYPQKVDKSAFAKIVQLLKNTFFHTIFFPLLQVSSSILYPFTIFSPWKWKLITQTLQNDPLTRRQEEGSKTLLSLCFGIFAINKMFVWTFIYLKQLSSSYFILRPNFRNWMGNISSSYKFKDLHLWNKTKISWNSIISNNPGIYG